MTASVVLWLALKTTNTEVPGSITRHSLGFFWGSWVWNGVHSASWSDKLSSYLNKEVTVRFGKLMCWPHVNPVPSGAVGKDCQRQLLSRPRFVRACSATEGNMTGGCDFDLSGSGWGQVVGFCERSNEISRAIKGIFWLAEQLLVCQQGLCSMDLDSFCETMVEELSEVGLERWGTTGEHVWERRHIYTSYLSHSTQSDTNWEAAREEVSLEQYVIIISIL
jgi:hypothetical protein